MFTTIIVQPIFNLLVLIYNLVPGHNFGVALIIFTVLVRLALWPLVKRQMHQTKLMRKLQPELKRIRKEAKGDKVKEQQMMMELYKERGISLFASFKVLLIQVPILFGLYLGLTRVVKDPQQLVSFSYPWLQDFSWMQELARDISKFDETLFGLIDLTRPAIGPDGLYVPALLLVIGSALIQYFQSKQLLPIDKDARGLRQILKEAGSGKQAETDEVNAAVSKTTVYIFPILIFVTTINFASALSLYWLVGGLVAFIQQTIVLRDDVDEMEALVDKSDKRDAKKAAKQAASTRTVIEGEVVAKTEKTRKGKKNKQKPAATAKPVAAEPEVVQDSPLKKDPNRRRQGAKVLARKRQDGTQS